MLHCLVLLITSSLLHTTCSTVYYVIPDDHYTTNNNTYTLQHYLNNTNKYLTSHTQLHFLPGQYYLNTDLIIQHVNNLSLIGSRTNEVINSVIKCTSPAGIVVVGSSNIVIANIIMNDCGSNFNESFTHHSFITSNYRCRISLLVLDSWMVTCKYFCCIWQHNPTGIKLVNGLGNTKLLNVASAYLTVWYDVGSVSMTNGTLTMHKIHIENFETHKNIKYTYAIDIQQYHSTANISVTLLNTKFKTELAIFIGHIDSGQIKVTVANCSFTSSGEDDPVAEHHPSLKNDAHDYNDSNDTDYIGYGCNDYIDGVIIHYDSMVSSFFMNNKKYTNLNIIQFKNCSFTNINNSDTGKLLDFSLNVNTEYLIISITNCLFYNNIYVTLVSIINYDNQFQNQQISVFLKDIRVLSSTSGVDAIIAYIVTLHAENIKFLFNTFNDHDFGSIVNAKGSYVQFQGYNEFFYNNASWAILSSSLYLQENTALNFTSNTFNIIINTDQPAIDDIDTCAIQYISKRGNLDDEFQQGYKLNYIITFTNNSINDYEISSHYLTHCAWDSSSAFISSIPLQVNHRFITGDKFMVKESKKLVCLCDRNGTHHCKEEKSGPYYPGQTVLFHFSLDDDIIKAARIEVRRGYSGYICDNGKLSLLQIQSNECKPLKYTIKHNRSWCELSLLVTPLLIFPGLNKPQKELYTIILQPSPRGFSLHPQGYCQCDPILSSHIPSLTTCDIDHQTIPRPAKTWISAHTINNSHFYHVSLHCPFDYCLPHSSQLNLSTPDSQCQFNRSGMLCGQCQHGLSTVFGSSQCKHCSNIYLLIIIPIGIAGLVLVFILFVFNLTVAVGHINPSLLYINIVSINASIFFPTGKSVMYTFTSLANLDLGIETCFFSEMGDYTKMWLQLVFPIYLIFIATLLIITSRYSNTIQRLTARRALPVLATLFLLSYTKVLVTVSNVLFSYTTITHLPSNHTTLVWSVDTSVPLFGVKFTILFIACLILFLILVPFNVVLIFTKKLSYFKVVTYFKPLLDAYQGPYKKSFYYWTGLLLLMRAIFFGLTALNRNTNLVIGIALLATAMWLHSSFFPFKNKISNISESLFLLNLIILFAVSLYTLSNSTAVTIFTSLAMLQIISIILIDTVASIQKKSCKNWTRFDFLRIIVEYHNQKLPGANEIQIIDDKPNYIQFQESLFGQD